MDNFLWVNGRMSGTQSTEAQVTINRRDPLFPVGEDGHTLTSVSRYRLISTLPLFDTKHWSDWAVGIKGKSSSTLQTQDVVWPAEQWLYDYRDVAERVDTAMKALATSAGLSPADFPRFIFDARDGSFAVVSSEAFREEYDVYFSDAIKYCLNTFYWKPYSPEMWRMVLTTDVEEQPIQTLELLSPIDKIVLKTSLPVSFEMMPKPEHPASISYEDGSFLVDMYWTQANNQSTVMTQFSVGDQSVARWYNMERGESIRKFHYEFFWTDRSGQMHDLKIHPRGYVDLKAVFKSIEIPDEDKAVVDDDEPLFTFN
ncbi:hypothetical protein FNF27_04202 [Cafeteria roenbergensis]|uniref:Uncharacterized protein n=1 Tax=Cafeteria roenbergensis TaxID=33653 RepID=A0A5A8EA25_CAFRO|nr:hypothetical protein FNF27_04202 [Cafeteria roenbergensis]